MYFYMLTETTYSDAYEDGYAEDYMYIYHNEEFDDIQFETMCNQAMDSLKGRGETFIYNKKLAEELQQMFDFKSIKTSGGFQYDVED